MKTLEVFTPNQLQDIRDFDTHIVCARDLVRNEIKTVQAAEKYRQHTQDAFDLYYSLTRNTAPDGTILKDGEMVSLLHTRLEQQGVKQYGA